ncbi:MAG TPA: FAD-dependent oxidoreductase [Burkholderiaceae bacterium]|nr:FAD-dependent oxidoreductase [Burkholderiaceae bacterium]
MGAGTAVRRRTLLAAAGASVAGCHAASSQLEGGWVGASHERGHRLRDTMPSATATPSQWRRASVIVVGGGIAGLAAARALASLGIDDVHLLELEEEPGGNSRGHVMVGIRCPLGAHYLPLPGPHAHEVAQLLHEFGLARVEAGRVVYDERHLCHSPQERLFVDGAWVEGLLPPAAAGSRREGQYRRFSKAVDDAMAHRAFAMPTRRAAWTPAHAALDAQPFARWLAVQGFDDDRLLWYLDYCCRDDYGAGVGVVSAWAGLHYFASRHGFHPHLDDDNEREPVLTWPEGNAWLARRLAQPLAGRLHAGRTVLRVSEERHAVRVLAWDSRSQRLEAWQAAQVIIATPLFVAARLLDTPLPALAEAVRLQRHAPWLVANLRLDGPLVDRPSGAPPSWDNVIHGGDARSLGYVDAMHQSPLPHLGPTVLSVYWTLPAAERRALLDTPWQMWAQRVIADLARVHPDLPAKVRRADLMRHGHAMSIPSPGVRGSAALQALASRDEGRVRFAHADLAGYSVFEEAYTVGVMAGSRAARSLRG